ncbi:cardiolipin hydrolase [Anaeramoeba flamelloides]|uniref:Mitochondrial cardiolipin hydrolase n=1 Tax=Anaeramoeba flamelloides TaxID=1746091 RepID=A0AAV7ZX65_9EUKA|nr:cardiolipin hydrolase [Anaeramoeba flamelloides]|eukprot:Anaeramoba_flamelloidesa816375_128.p1 GENE.a816375_128~~a816375_128.p1  ORF type:complete len:451 (+),score=86.27 a816375_128:3-1355(+)
MILKTLTLIFVTIFLLKQIGCATPPSYDHQKMTYVANHEPVTMDSADLTITPFFSPDNSIQTLTSLVESAEKRIDIGIPGFSSWSGCSYAKDGKLGCSASKQRNDEKFTIFPALLNALHRGVEVRILTNNYNSVPTYEDQLIDPLTFLKLAGADVRYFNTVTFLHTKYMQIDGKKGTISSVNYSHCSFMENREAGVVFEGTSAHTLLSFLDEIFGFDFKQATPMKAHPYNSASMAIIKDQTPISYTLPKPYNFKNAYVTPVTPVKGKFDNLQINASPDFSRSSLISQIQQAQTSFAVMIYQINDDGLCDMLEDLSLKLGKDNVKILVSRHIYGYDDWVTSQVCYKKLYKAGVKIQLTKSGGYQYSHQKFWIVDGQHLGMSTGNWSPTDYPDGSDVFPSYQADSSKWRKTNRDYTISLTNKDVVSIFQKVLDEDFERGSQYVPNQNDVRFG